jgi:signal transduction histidine kinase/ActR/RegA family two-component response regulator
VCPLIGRDFADVLRTIWPEPFASEAIGHFRRTLETGEPYHAPSSVERRRDIGEVESYDWKTERVMLPDGRYGVVCHFYDLSERQRYEAALRESEARLRAQAEELGRLYEALREADRRKDSFLATLAHELRNPLAPIRNAVQILKQQAPPEPNLQAARDIIERQVRHMVRLIDDLLDTSRITQGKLELRRERIALATVIEQALETIRPHLGHELAVSLPEERIELDADPVRLAQVFSNLLNNACKYTEKGGRIRLGAERDGGEVVVTVKDSGIGISPDHLPRLFEMFAQLDYGRERARGGLGIGLWLCRWLVELHGGSIAARSEGQGKGSEFIVRLPIAAGPGSRERRSAEAPAQAAHMARRILVVDDVRDSAESLATLLRMDGHEVDTAYDGLQALEKARAMKPDLVLLDLGLPELDGYGVCRAIRATRWGASASIVAMTGWGQDEDRRKSGDAGFDAHLVKPVDHAALVQLLRSSVPGRAA